MPNLKLRKKGRWEKQFWNKLSPGVRFDNTIILKEQQSLKAYHLVSGSKTLNTVYTSCPHTLDDGCCLCEHPTDKRCVLECCGQCGHIVSHNMETGTTCLDANLQAFSLSTICQGPSETVFGFDKLSGNIVQLRWSNEDQTLRKTRTHNLDSNCAVQRMCYVDLHEVLVFTYAGSGRPGIRAVKLYDDSTLWDLPNQPIDLFTLCADETGRVFVTKHLFFSDSEYTIVTLDCRTGEKMQTFSLPLDDIGVHMRLFAGRSALIVCGKISGLLQSSAKVTCFEVTQENEADC